MPTLEELRERMSQPMDERLVRALERQNELMDEMIDLLFITLPKLNQRDYVSGSDLYRFMNSSHHLRRRKRNHGFRS